MTQQSCISNKMFAYRVGHIVDAYDVLAKCTVFRIKVSVSLSLLMLLLFLCCFHCFAFT